ncbi:Endo-beta-1,6-galactanase [Galdieria sulphuraria]|nr:Endo-beta-1,6-galactanase [Galdieria sulphuraria]
MIELISKLFSEPLKDLEISRQASVGPTEYKEQIADLLFDVQQGLGLNIVRYNIGGGENPNIRVTLEPRACIPGLYTSANQVSSLSLEQDAGQLWFLQAAVKRGVDKLEVFSNSPPYFMTKSGSVTGARMSSENNLVENQVDNFAEYLCRSTQLIENSCHIQCESIEPFNEPLSSWWKLGGRQEGCYFDCRLQEKVIDSLYHQIRKWNLGYCIAAPDTYSVEEAKRLVNSYSSQTLSQLNRINTHTYNAKGRRNLLDMCSKRRKLLWVSEYGDNDGSGISLAQTIISDLKELHANAWIYWQAVEDSSAPHWGFLVCNLNQPTGNDSFTIQKKFYIMLQFSKFIRPGFQQIDIDDDTTVAFRSPDEAKIVLVHVQRQSNTYHLCFKDFDRESFAQISVYRTSSHENMERIGFYQRWPLQRRLSLSMANNSVTTIVVS